MFVRRTMKMKCAVIMLAVFSLGYAAEDCNLVKMSQWAGESSLRREALPSPVDIVIIQHTVTPEPITDQECERVLQAIRKYQREKLKFDDIAESFLVCGNGKIYEGAGWGLVGAHTRNYNKKSIGISFIGEFGSHLPNSAALTAVQELISCGVKNGHLASQYRLLGHRQLSSTLSPGDELQKTLETWPHWTRSL